MAVADKRAGLGFLSLFVNAGGLIRLLVDKKRCRSEVSFPWDGSPRAGQIAEGHALVPKRFHHAQNVIVV